MERSLLVWLVLLMVAMSCDPSLARARSGSGGNRRPRKNKNNGQRNVISYNLGAFIPSNTKPRIDFNTTEEAHYYRSNYTHFPTGIFFPWNPDSDVFDETEEAFVKRCFNATVTENKLELSEDGNKDLNIAERVMMRLINYLCLRNYGKNNATATKTPFLLLIGMLCLSFTAK